MVNLADSTVNSISPFAEGLTYLGAVLLVLFLAYMSTKFLSRMNFSNVKNKHIKLIDKFFISSDRSILLFKVEKKVYLIASDKTGLKILDSLSEEEIPTYIAEEKKTKMKTDGANSPLSSFAEKLKNKQKLR